MGDSRLAGCNIAQSGREGESLVEAGFYSGEVRDSCLYSVAVQAVRGNLNIICNQSEIVHFHVRCQLMLLCVQFRSFVQNLVQNFVHVRSHLEKLPRNFELKKVGGAVTD